jgi:hypothetical protein
MVELEVVSLMQQELQDVNPMEVELEELNPAMEELEVSQDMEEDEDEGGLRRRRRRRSTTSECVQFRVWEKQNNQDEVHHHHHHHSHDGFKGCSRAASTSGCDIHICRCCCSSGMIRNHQHHHGTGDHHNAAAELLARSFQLAVSAHDWVVAESLVPFFLADAHRLNDALCIALDSIWFLRYTQVFLHSPPPWHHVCAGSMRSEEFMKHKHDCNMHRSCDRRLIALQVHCNLLCVEVCTYVRLQIEQFLLQKD